MVYRCELVQEPSSCGNEVLIVQIRSQPVGGATWSAPLNLPLINDLIRYSWSSGDTVRSQLIQGRALVEVSRKLCELCIQKEDRQPILKLVISFIPKLIQILLHPCPFTGFVLAVYMACVSQRVLHPGLFTGFVLAVSTDCVSYRGCRCLYKISTRLDYSAKLHRLMIT